MNELLKDQIIMPRKLPSDYPRIFYYDNQKKEFAWLDLDELNQIYSKLVKHFSGEGD